MLSLGDSKARYWGAFVALMAVGGAVWVATAKSEVDLMLEACDSAIQERLRSPSTYVRVGFSPIKRRDASLNEFLGIPHPEQRARHDEAKAKNKAIADFDADMRKYFRMGEHEFVYTIVEYDAENGFGAPIRSTAECSLVVPTGSEAKPKASTVSIDGYTTLDWALSRIGG